MCTQFFFIYIKGKEGIFLCKLTSTVIFANFVLADEINRAPAKVQSALLEAMQEKQVTIGDETFKLPNPFLVLATHLLLPLYLCLFILLLALRYILF